MKSGIEILVHAPDGTTTDVTESVQALYDLVLASMDWGSGFLSVEDAVPVALIGELCGFEQAEEAARYVEKLRVQQEALAARDRIRQEYHDWLEQHDGY